MFQTTALATRTITCAIAHLPAIAPSVSRLIIDHAIRNEVHTAGYNITRKYKMASTTLVTVRNRPMLLAAAENFIMH